MASSAISVSPSFPLDMHIICSICMEVFVDPVTTACGHSFCKKCLDFSFRYNASACPLCKTLHSKTPEVNIVLRDIVQQLKANMVEDDLYMGKDDEVPCDICTQVKHKAHKSCLVCLASYCSTHLENHCSSKRLKGHKLVAPVKNLDERACLKHGRPLELYDRKQKKCICVRCLDEGPEDVVSTEEEWDNKRAELENTKMQLNDNIEKRKTKMAELSSSLQICTEQLDSEWWDIDNVFTAIIAIVKEAQATALRPLEVRRQRVHREAADLKKELEADVDKLDNAISELTRISTWEDHILFLQSYPTLPHLDGDIRDLADIEFDTSLTFGTMRKTMAIMMEHIQQELEKLASIELARVSKLSVDVNLDPTTAHQHCVLSKHFFSGETLEGGSIHGL